ncbi:Phosphomannomutase/phosphoglucomutase [Psychrobacter sp. SC65A.3]|uniref:phosphomannomutase n=1 Tax=Psychrobacter sp. SC65A.3 TaxID=2983299 RepID=UPI0021DA1E85|nr:phosphomannomutase [Psychrobacter sp. SC65A.3]WAI88494.1 Phosphomannomutase/phosphoglucomutase [Psychrobacter sp. SC65A.3]
MPFFAAQHSLFRAYDIRGSRQHFTTDFVQALGYALAHLYHVQQDSDNKKNIVVIGYDVRRDSDVIAQNLATILSECGLQVIQLGLITTPMMVFWAEQYQGHGIIVTASHSAKDILGVKWLVNHQSPSVEDIQTLYQQVTQQQLTVRSLDNSMLEKSGLPKDGLQETGFEITDFQKVIVKKDNQKGYKASSTPRHVVDNPISNQQMSLSPEQVAAHYIDAIVQVFKALYPHDNQSFLTKVDLVVVIDCMHGATSHIAQQLFERYCQNVIMLNNVPNGDFPAGNPDPTEPNRLTQLQQSVVNHQADIGIAFDGDGDRLMIVDNTGKVVTPDHLLYLLARVILTERPVACTQLQSPPQILFDIKCSHHLPKLLTELGAEPIISKTGSSLMRQQMQDSAGQIVFAGELSGHFIFNDSRFIVYDDAIYAALRLLHWLAADNSNSLNPTTNLANIIYQLPNIVSTADHYLPLPVSVSTDCSIIEQLTRLCVYLQQLIKVIAPLPTQAEYQVLSTCQRTLCSCSIKNLPISIEQAKDLLPIGTTLSCIDGVRLDFAHGFGVIRQSNTSHNLTARFAGDSMAHLQDIQAKFAALCFPFDENLAAQIVAISPQ